jgi:predicted aspartyl protease
MLRSYFLLCIATILTITSCDSKQKKPPYNLDTETTATKCISIPYEEFGGVKFIPVKLNGITMNMIYDTGCSGLHISLNEVQTLAKNGKLDAGDILEASYSMIADGSIVENGTINIKRIEIGGEDGIVLENIQASVELNQDAPVLLGNAVLDEFASVEVDNISKTINFNKK